MSINRKFFFDQVKQRLFGGKLKQSQIDGMNAVLDYWEAHHADKDDRWLAYALGTDYHETAQTMQAIEEYGKGRGRKYGVPVNGKVYFGRGLVQLTWDYNYKKLGAALGLNLFERPEIALQLSSAVQIMFYGMENGVFTGKKFADYFNRDKEDWINARRIINGTDRAALVADYGKKFYSAISYTK